MHGQTIWLEVIDPIDALRQILAPQQDQGVTADVRRRQCRVS
jgi:hypothetical protein